MASNSSPPYTAATMDENEQDREHGTGDMRNGLSAASDSAMNTAAGNPLTPPKETHAHARKRKASDGTKTSPTKKRKTKATTRTRSGSPDVTSIHLAGEDAGAVPIYDTCNEARRKIRQHLKRAGGTKAAFVRGASRAAFADERALTTRQLNAFLDKKGPTGGADSPVFYAAYVWFEKLRLLEGKGKGKTREEMEREWGPDGVPRRRMDRVRCKRGEHPWEDRYGRLHIDDRKVPG